MACTHYKNNKESMKKKYLSEVEMCKDLTSLISGMLIPEKHKHISEVPRFSHNNHADMLFLFEDGDMFVVEYKLNNPLKLLEQVKRNNFTIGIVNCNIKESFNKYLLSFKIFQYTGQDWELEKISKYLALTRQHRANYQKRREGLTSVYYWGYKKMESSLNGGFRTGKRLSFFELYKQAIFNLQEYYKWKLDFYLVYGVLGVYELGTAKKHYNDLIKTRDI